MERVSGYLSETKPLSDESRGHEVVRYEVGDICYLPLQDIYAELVAITVKDGGSVFQFGVPKEGYLTFRAWCVRNPHKVKVLVSGYQMPTRDYI